MPDTNLPTSPTEGTPPNTTQALQQLLDGDQSLLGPLLERYWPRIAERAEITRQVRGYREGVASAEDIALQVIQDLSMILQKEKPWPKNIPNQNGAALRALIATMVLRRWRSEFRYETARCRDRRRTVDGRDILDAIPVSGGDPDLLPDEVNLIHQDIARLRAMVAERHPQGVALFDDLAAGLTNAQIKKKRRWLDTQLKHQMDYLLGLFASWQQATEAELFAEGDE